MSDDIPIYWSAGGGKGWPQQAVVDLLIEKFGFTRSRDCLIWAWGEPLPIKRGGQDPVIVTCDPQKADVLLLLGREVAFLPNLMPEPHDPPPGYAERFGGGGDPWLMYTS